MGLFGLSFEEANPPFDRESVSFGWKNPSLTAKASGQAMFSFNIKHLFSYLLFTFLDLELYFKHHLKIMDSLYYSLLLFN